MGTAMSERSQFHPEVPAKTNSRREWWIVRWKTQRKSWRGEAGTTSGLEKRLHVILMQNNNFSNAHPEHESQKGSERWEKENAMENCFSHQASRMKWKMITWAIRDQLSSVKLSKVMKFLWEFCNENNENAIVSATEGFSSLMCLWKIKKDFFMFSFLFPNKRNEKVFLCL